MNTQNKEHSAYEDEINLYDYWKVVIKRKKLIIGLFLISVVLTAIISLLMPKIYRGEATFRITAKEIITEKEIITAKEMVRILGKLDRERLRQIFLRTYYSIVDIKLTPLRDSTDKLQLIIDTKKVDEIPNALQEFIEYMNNNPLIKRSVEEAKESLLKQREELSDVIEASRDSVKTYDGLLKTGKLIALGFNPIEINKSISKIKMEKLKVEQTLERLKGIEMIALPYISSKPVKPKVKLNIVLAGTISLLAGIFLAFFMEYLERNKLILGKPV